MQRRGRGWEEKGQKRSHDWLAYGSERARARRNAFNVRTCANNLGTVCNQNWTWAAEGMTWLTTRYSLNTFSERRPIRALELVGIEANKSSKTGLGLTTDSTAFLVVYVKYQFANVGTSHSGRNDCITVAKRFFLKTIPIVSK